MDKITFKNSKNKILVGNLYRADSDKAIIMAHGLTGDKSSGGRFDKIATALQKDIYNVLSFDFSGCGESEDENISVEKEVNDLNSALQYMKSLGCRTFAFYGHSLGSLVCMKSYSKEIKSMVFTGALTGNVNYDWTKYFSAEQLKLAQEVGYLIEKRQAGVRQEIVYDKQIMRDFTTINQQELLSSISCPILLIHGNNPEDTEELQFLENSKKGMKYLSEESKLVVIENGKHGLYEHVDVVIQEMRTWYRVYLT